MTNTKEKESRLSRQVMHAFQERGWLCTKSAASLGVFDLVCIPSEKADYVFVRAPDGINSIKLQYLSLNPNSVIGIQFKTGDSAGKPDQQFKELKFPNQVSITKYWVTKKDRKEAIWLKVE